MEIKNPQPNKKYPRYTREENLACKLTDTQILEAQNLHKEGISYKKIAKLYEVSKGCIIYWCWPEEIRKERGKIQRERKNPTPYSPSYNKKIKERKKRICPEFFEYKRESDKNYFIKYPNKVRKQKKESYYKHRDQILLKRRQKYHLKKYGNPNPTTQKARERN